jgi:hypothetical protein
MRSAWEAIRSSVVSAATSPARPWITFVWFRRL